MEKQLQEHIESLLRLYDEARTTDEQEAELAAFFRTTKDVPEEWMGYADLFSVFDTSDSLFSEDELDDCLMEPISQQDEKKPKTHRVWLYPVISAVAASVLLLLILDVCGRLQGSPQTIVENPMDSYKNVQRLLTQCPRTLTEKSKTFDSKSTDNSLKVHVHLTQSPRSLDSKSMFTTSKVHAGSETQLEEMVVSTEKNEVAVTETADVIIAETVNDIPTDRQALADIYLAETALQVAYERLAQMDELKAYAISLEAEEPQSSQLIVAF